MFKASFLVLFDTFGYLIWWVGVLWFDCICSICKAAEGFECCSSIQAFHCSWAQEYQSTVTSIHFHYILIEVLTNEIIRLGKFKDLSSITFIQNQLLGSVLCLAFAQLLLRMMHDDAAHVDLGAMCVQSGSVFAICKNAFANWISRYPISFWKWQRERERESGAEKTPTCYRGYIEAGSILESWSDGALCKYYYVLLCITNCIIICVCACWSFG